MRKPSSSSKNVIAALVAAAFGLTAGPALAQSMSQSNPHHTPASHRHASTAKLNRATAQLRRTTHNMKAAQSKELRVASAEHHVRKGERTQQTKLHHRRNARPTNSTPPPR